MNNGKIYAIVSGELYAGYSVRGVYATKEAALLGIKLLVTKENDEDSSYKKTAIDGRWVDGTYYIEIVEWPLNKLFA